MFLSNGDLEIVFEMLLGGRKEIVDKGVFGVFGDSDVVEGNMLLFGKKMYEVWEVFFFKDVWDVIDRWDCR